MDNNIPYGGQGLASHKHAAGFMCTPSFRGCGQRLDCMKHLCPGARSTAYWKLGSYPEQKQHFKGYLSMLFKIKLVFTVIYQ
jgi:hypothetical protein